MSRTYSTEGITLKASNLGESDRILTVLTPELGLLRAIAPGSRKYRNSLTGRSGLFVINRLLIAPGKSLDRITQADTSYTFPSLSRSLGRLTAAQYLAEVVLCQAVENQAQPDLYNLLRAHLERLEQAAPDTLLAHLCQALFHLLALEGVAPQVHRCCLSQAALVPPLADPRWRACFSCDRGGLISPAAIATVPASNGDRPQSSPPGSPPPITLSALEVALLQQLNQPQLPDLGELLSQTIQAMSPQDPAAGMPYRSPWPRIEQALRQYIQYHFDRSIRSAALIDSTFGSSPAIAAP